MPEAIRDRRPTEADADWQGWVEVWESNFGYWCRYQWDSERVQKTKAHWRHIDQTPPEPEKPKRRKGWCLPCNSIEVLPGDPKDLDALLELIDEAEKETRWAFKIDCLNQIIEARHGKGGD